MLRLTKSISDFSTSPDEHIFDVLLPLGAGALGNIQIGHIDVKLFFRTDGHQPLPKIQVTLLKQNLKNHKFHALYSNDAILGNF